MKLGVIIDHFINKHDKNLLSVHGVYSSGINYFNCWFH